MAKREHSPDDGRLEPEEATPSPSRPGVLTVVLHEGTGLSIPDGYEQDQRRPSQQGLSMRNTPYAVLDYNKSQQQADPCEGTAQDPVWVSDIAPWRLDEVTGEYHDANWKFDVSRPAELAIHLYIRDPHASPCLRSRDAFIGVTRIPIDASQAPASEEAPSQWVDERYDMRQMSLEDPEPESNFDMDLNLEDDAAIAPDFNQTASISQADDDADGWELMWETGNAGPGELYFRHGPTGEKKPVPIRTEGPSHEITDAASSVDSTAPNTSQKLDALEAALQAGHDHIVSQIVLEHGIDLNIRLFGYQRISPLEWAVDHGNLRLVRLFLSNGADVNFPGYEARVWDRGGPLMVRAVATKNRELAELLLTLSKTMNKTPDRVDLTRALGLAVDQRDAAMARLLLANGARCDFEDGDRPLPENGPDDGCSFYDISEPTEFIPPLVRAVKLGDVGMVRLLLERGGADANVGYHDLTAEGGKKDIRFSCGRVIELAMELGRRETVKLLLAAGADLCVEKPVWRVPGHTCSEVSRAFYQSITARLRAAEESLKGQKDR
ncbi:hypothetical protein CCMA1212_002673 [Trichoderma ghanense]|uniref:Ankyrin repeat protein n=1 Tax=Trichoderma ghanense TaxID=65468 RepID=A0ABY2H9Z9_9HYPO